MVLLGIPKQRNFRRLSGKCVVLTKVPEQKGQPVPYVLLRMVAFQVCGKPTGH